LGSVWEACRPEAGGGEEGEGICSLCCRCFSLSLFLAKLWRLLLLYEADIVVYALTGGAEGSGEQAFADSELGDCG